MSRVDEPWYVRFPDGRVHRVSNTESVRQQLGLGRIPLASLVRRHADEEWTSLEWTAEFADLCNNLNNSGPASSTRLGRPRPPAAAQPKHPSSGDPPVPRRTNNPPVGGEASPGGQAARGAAPAGTATVASRLDPEQLQTIGVQGWMQELLAALDSLLVRKKLLTAALTGLALGVILALFRSGVLDLLVPGSNLGGLVAMSALLVVVVLCVVLLTQLTSVELSKLRPARWREGLAGLTGRALRLLLVYLLLLGTTLVVVLALTALSARLVEGAMAALADDRNAWGQSLAALAGVAGVLALLGEVFLVPLFGLSLLLGPILVVERCSAWKAVQQWWRLIRLQPGPVLAFQILATTVGLLVALPFAIPLLPLPLFPLDERLAHVWNGTRDVLTGLAVAPFVAYLAVANNFIYLNLRYGTMGRQRPRETVRRPS